MSEIIIKWPLGPYTYFTLSLTFIDFRRHNVILTSNVVPRAERLKINNMTAQQNIVFAETYNMMLSQIPCIRKKRIIQNENSKYIFFCNINNL